VFLSTIEIHTNTITMEFFAIILSVALMQIATINSFQNVPYSSQQTTAFEQFMRPEHTCSINWVLETGQNCEWCEAMFSQLIPGLTQGYHPSSIHTEGTVARDEKEFWNFDLKGICSLNWFMAEDFEKLFTISNSPKSNRFQIDDWFLYIRVCSVF